MTARLRVGLVADLLEERWPSMDIVADALHAELAANPDLEVSLIRPSFATPRLSLRVPALERYRRRFWSYPRWLRLNAPACDVYHVIDHSYAHVTHALPSERTIVTCHDIDAFLSLVDPTLTRSRLPRFVTDRVLRGLRLAARVTCDSQATRHEIERYALVDAERLTVAGLGIDAEFFVAPPAASCSSLDSLLGRRNQAVPELLHVGTCIPRKRIDVLLKVFAAVRAAYPSARLLKAGGRLSAPQVEQARRLGVLDHIVQLPFLPRATISALYRRADVVLVTSEREGFGFPVLESLASGTPVVATDLPVLHEVGASLVRYCALNDVDGWKREILDVLASAPASEPARSVRAAHASSFTWKSYAAVMRSLYEEVATGHDRVRVA